MKNKYLTREEISDLLRMHKDGFRSTFLAKKFRCSQATINYHARMAGIARPPGNKLTKAELEETLKYYKSFGDIERTAERIGRTPENVYWRIKKYFPLMPIQWKAGTNSSSTKQYLDYVKEEATRRGRPFKKPEIPAFHSWM